MASYAPTPIKWLAPLLLATMLFPVGVTGTEINDTDAYKHQRALFEQAERAINKGQLSYYQKLKPQLEAYPLLPYLEYRELMRSLNSQPAEKIQTFIQHHADTPLATRLLENWLKNLAQHGEWQTLVDNYFTNDNLRLQCQYANALYQTGEAERAHVITQDLWLTGRSLPNSCDGPIESLRQAGKLSTDLIWQRIKLTMQKGNIRLTRYLGKMLPEDQRFWIPIWEKVRRHPDYVMQVSKHFANKNDDMLHWITVYGLRRLASRDPLLAAEYREQLQQQFPFTATEQARIERSLILSLVQEDSEDAGTWLQKMKFSRLSDDVAEAYVLSAIRDEDWELALEWLQRLEPEAQHSDRWSYWRGRILEALGRLDESRSAYLLNADNRGYYSFLAADRIGSDYQFSHRPLSFSATELDSVKTNPGILRAGELYALKRVADARREWNHTILGMNKAQLLKAAKLSNQWGWHDRTIITLARAQYWDDLELRFPLAYQEKVLIEARKQNINPAWAFAVIRQESAFTTDARSHAGAMGLMQLLPRTARQVARSLRVPMRGRDALLNSNTNIKLGVSYLRKVKERHEGHAVLATAAYNAGSRHVKRWQPEQTSLPADLWIEMVPFSETSKYMKRVLTYTVIYEQRLGLSLTPLLERMAPIPPSQSPAKLSTNSSAEQTTAPRRS